MTRPPRLTLSWINKDMTLLGDGAGYVWANTNDPRAREIRLLEEGKLVGEGARSAPEDNLLIVGDSADAMRTLINHPDYDDSLEHSVWLTMMRDRLKLIHELLAPTGTVWIHLDATEAHRCRCLMDDEFGPRNYLATVVWQRTSAKSLAKRTMGTMHEQILVYGATEAADLKPMFIPLDGAYQASRFSQTDDRGDYDTGDLTAGSYRPHLDSGQPWRGFDPGTRRRCWAVPSNLLAEIDLSAEKLIKLTMRQKLDELDKAGYIHWPMKLDGFPRYKKYLHRSKGRLVGDLWTDVNVINSQAGERTGFSTQKPEALLQRVLAMGSEPGEIVLDCFAGSGTTAAVAQKMGRRWVTIEREPTTATDVIAPRLTKVVAGTDDGGITQAEDWTGGGGFRTHSVAPAVFAMHGGRLVMEERATGATFAETVRAQLKYPLFDRPPFSGKRGRNLLAVIDGSADEVVVRSVLSHLDEGEAATIVAKATTVAASTMIRASGDGSRLLRAPKDLFPGAILR